MALSPSSRLGLPTTALLPEDTERREENEGMAKTKEQAELRDGFRDHCRLLLLEEADRRDTTLTRRDVRDWLAAMDEQNLTAKTEAEKTKIVRSLAEGTYVEKFIQDARNAAAEGLRLIADAEGKKWILPSSAKEWRDRVKNEGVSWVEKKKFIEETLPEWHKNWQKIATDYKDVKKLEKDLKMEPSEARRFAVLEDLHDSKFMSGALEFTERRRRVDQALKFLKTYKKKTIDTALKELPAPARAEMQKAIGAKAVDELRSLRWLRDKLQSLPTDTERREYVAHQLPAYVQSCIRVRAAYDQVAKKMRENGVPWGFNDLTPEQFIGKLTLRQRESYVEMARARMREEEPFFTEMKNLKFGIWSALDTKDWEEAENLLKKAQKLREAGNASDRDKEDLGIMERNLAAFRERENNEQKPKEDVKNTLTRVGSALREVPDVMKSLYLGVIAEGPECFHSFRKYRGNREWVTQHGYSNPHLEKVREEQAKGESAIRAKGVHGKKGVECVHLDYVDDPDHAAAVRRYDGGEWAPTYLFMSERSNGKLLSLLRNRKGNYASDYWMNLVHTGVPFEKDLHLIHNVDRVIESGTRSLQEHGIPLNRIEELTRPSPLKPPSAKKVPLPTLGMAS